MTSFSVFDYCCPIKIEAVRMMNGTSPLFTLKQHTVIMAAGIALAALVSHMPVNAQNLTENLDLNVNIANNHL